MTDPKPALLPVEQEDPFCLCCTRRKSEHTRGQCPETAYFVENKAATPAPTCKEPGGVEKRAARFISLMWPSLPLHLRRNMEDEYRAVIAALRPAASAENGLREALEALKPFADIGKRKANLYIRPNDPIVIEAMRIVGKS